MPYFLHNKAGGRKDTGPDHVGNDKDDGGEEADSSRKIVIIRTMFHRELYWRRFGVSARLLLSCIEFFGDFSLEISQERGGCQAKNREKRG